MLRTRALLRQLDHLQRRMKVLCVLLRGRQLEHGCQTGRGRPQLLVIAAKAASRFVKI